MFSFLLSLLNNSCFISYINTKSFALPLTNKEEQYYLEKKEIGDKQARNILIERNLRLVAHIAKKYNNNKYLQEDLISIGTIGLIKAIDSYQINKKTKLASYASRCIENEILMHLRSTKKQNAEVSLNEVIGTNQDGSEITLEELIDNKEEPLIDQLYKKDNLITLKDNLNILSNKEKDIIIKRYGLNNTTKMTQSEIAKQYHISRSYISRIEKKALIKLLKKQLEKTSE